MIHSIFYVSKSRLQMPADRGQLEKIQITSILRNSAADVTGVLIATPDHFAQFIEGARSAIDAIMASILVDDRHSEVTVTETAQPDGRLFPTWSMACFGPGNFVSRHVQPLLERYHAGLPLAEVEKLISFIGKLAGTSRKALPGFDD